MARKHAVYLNIYTDELTLQVSYQKMSGEYIRIGYFSYPAFYSLHIELEENIFYIRKRRTGKKEYSRYVMSEQEVEDRKLFRAQKVAELLWK